MRNTILMVVIIAVSSNVTAADWVGLPANHITSKGPEGNVNNGKVLTVLLDKTSIVRDGDSVTVWFKMRWGDNEYSQQYNSTFDCKRRVSNKNDGFEVGNDGRHYPNASMRSGGFTPIPPDTASEVVFNNLCAKKPWEFWK